MTVEQRPEIEALLAERLGRDWLLWRKPFERTLDWDLPFAHSPDLPKTRSGKIMGRLLRDIADGRTLGDTTTLADTSVVETIRERSGAAEED